MAGSVNKVILIGNLGADPEVRHTQDGRPIVNLRLATSESWRDKASGERKERTEWHRVVIFSEPLCRVAEQYLKKGSKIYVEGQLQTRKWQDQSGPGPLLDRGGAARLQLAAHHARRPSGRRRRSSRARRRFQRRFRTLERAWRRRRPLLRQGARRRNPVLRRSNEARRPFQATGLPRARATRL